MARTKGSFTLAGAIEPLISAPLDSRDKVATKAELTASGNFPYPYVGMETYVVAEDKKYRLIGDDPTNIENWKEVAEGGGGGTSDYSDLSNKPSIENVTLSGNKSASDLGLAKLTDLADFITKTVDDLVNYYTKSQSYSKTEVDAIVTAIKNSRFEVVATLPTSDIKTNVIYLVPKADAESGDVKDEYINLDGTTAGWEKIGSTEVDLSGYVTTTALNTALTNYTTTTDLTTLLANKQDKVQVYTMPTATEDLVGKMYQYLGATNATYTHGYWYECVVGTEPNTYMWQQTSVQPASSLAVEDSEGTALTQRDTMQFGTGFNATDDSENEKTVVEADLMQSGDMDDIVTPLPSIAPKKEGIKYSTTEQVVGEWIDGKPIYQRTIDCGILTSGDSSISHNISNIDLIVDFWGRLNEESGTTILINSKWGSSIVAVDCFINKSVINISANGSAISSYLSSVYVTIQYTKTTDTATT